MVTPRGNPLLAVWKTPTRNGGTVGNELTGLRFGYDPLGVQSSGALDDLSDGDVVDGCVLARLRG